MKIGSVAFRTALAVACIVVVLAVAVILLPATGEDPDVPQPAAFSVEAPLAAVPVAVEDDAPSGMSAPDTVLSGPVAPVVPVVPDPARDGIPFIGDAAGLIVPDLERVTVAADHAAGHDPEDMAMLPRQPRIAVIIDDLGANRAGTRDTVALPAPLTLAYLPYPEHIREQVEEGRTRGHEIMVHMPMEPLDGAQATGDYVLRTGMDPDDFTRVMDGNLSAFGGYAGINNHMGSRLTQDRAAMARVMAALKDRGLFFVDSRTIASSVAADEAAQAGVPYAVRDVFLDHDTAPESVRHALAQAESIARRKGVAVAIGHPKPATIAALAEWIPGLKDKGILLVPVSAVVSAPAAPAHRLSKVSAPSLPPSAATP